ncbi:MAG: type IV pilin protein [Telluria sp.]
MKGFSLIEVLVVTAILALLAGLAYPSYAEAARRAKRAEGQLALVEAMQQEERYLEDHGKYAPFSQAGGAPGGFRWWSGSSAAGSAYEIDAYPCPGLELDKCIVLRARPGTDKVDAHFRDPDCGVLTVDSTGRQTASGPLASCWP